MSSGEKNSCGSAVWMMTGILSRAQTSQTGFRSGSSTCRRDPSVFRASRPRPFAIFESDGAVLDGLLEVGHRLLTPARRVGVVPVHVGEHAEPVRVLARPDELHLLLDRRGVAAAQVDEHAQVERVHFLDELLDVVRVDGRVVVAVDDRELGFRNLVLFDLQRRARPVVDDARRREFRRAAPERPRSSSCPAGIPRPAESGRRRRGRRAPGPAGRRRAAGALALLRQRQTAGKARESDRQQK